MLTKLLGKKKSGPERDIPPVLQNLSSVQQEHYEKFKEQLREFYLGKDLENPHNNILHVGISDGYLGSIPIGEITEEGIVHLKYPSPKSIDSEGFRYILDGTLRLRGTLEEKGIPYKEDINRDEYIQQVRERNDSKVLDLVARIR